VTFADLGPWGPALVVAIGLAAGLSAAFGVPAASAALRSRAWTPLILRRLATVIRPPAFDDDEFFRADGAPRAVQERRRRALDALSRRCAAAFAGSAPAGAALRDSFSDLRFTDLSRVPFPFARVMREKFSLISFVDASRGPWLRHVDGPWTLDVSGAYGLNVAGFDRMKGWMAEGGARVADLGPVLGPLHPVVADNVATLKSISGLDEVSFHMSGTEAVMAAVRLARFNTRRRLVVCFSGAYHGWWDGVQPGLGSERDLGDCLLLKDMSPASLAAIRRRRGEIAAVLVNPVQSFHPNTPPPSDAVLLSSAMRTAADAGAGYGAWLQALRQTCTGSGVPLIVDEVYTGFRLAPGGAQAYFGVQADMVVYGKTVAGGMPVGVVCGRSALMRRTDPDHPLRMAYVVGTFSAHPVVMGAMRAFLDWIEAPEAAARYSSMNTRCAAWVQATNQRLAEAGLPLRVAHLGTIWTVLFTEAGRYNWLLQYYLRAEGVTLSWVGTGRCLVSMDFTDDDYDALTARLTAAAQAMATDGWWLSSEDLPGKDRIMRQRLVREAIGSLIPPSARAFYTAVKQRKADDHHTSHNNAANQYLHLVSSSVFIYCYVVMAIDFTQAMFLGVAALLVRQFGHAVLEPSCHDEEKLLLGYSTRNKSLILAAYVLIPLIGLAQASAWRLPELLAEADGIARLWFGFTLAMVFGRTLWLAVSRGGRIAMIWLVKLVTDPFTDIATYLPLRAERA
jgi:glutamate-1-semialdehyde 2,1-aminomutase